jgi:hypothetical protein
MRSEGGDASISLAEESKEESHKKKRSKTPVAKKQTIDSDDEAI